MENEFDMCVDFNSLCDIEEKLKNIGSNLTGATEQMLLAIQESQGFLEGQQFEKAQKTTMSCINVTAKTNNNIRNALRYIEQLKSQIDAYNKCKYEEGEF